MASLVQKMDFPKFHKNLLTISLFHRQTILEKYADILGINNVDHLSINVIDPKGTMLFLSSTPLTGINVCSSKLYLSDFSIHPSMYMKKDFYWWDKCYAPHMASKLKLEKEIKNNLTSGFIVTERKNDFVFLYSFATKGKGKENLEQWQSAETYQSLFKDMGRYCFNSVKNLYCEITGNEIDFEV